jgi:hypothetical protein
MSRPQFQLKQLTSTTFGECVLRFTFGGLIAVTASLISKGAGPALGGAFLAFPALLPASITLVGKHNGRAPAIDDARGACLGSIGLGAFAFTVWVLSKMRYVSPVPILAIALLVWLTVSYTLWKLLLDREDA